MSNQANAVRESASQAYQKCAKLTQDGLEKGKKISAQAWEKLNSKEAEQAWQRCKANLSEFQAEAQICFDQSKQALDPVAHLGDANAINKQIKSHMAAVKAAQRAVSETQDRVGRIHSTCVNLAELMSDDRQSSSRLREITFSFYQFIRSAVYSEYRTPKNCHNILQHRIKRMSQLRSEISKMQDLQQKQMEALSASMQSLHKALQSQHPKGK
jgi:hypothetical protein